MEKHSTYHARSMDDSKTAWGHPWEKATLRIFHNDERQLWSVCPPHCSNYGTALISWFKEGQFFDGTAWRPIPEWTAEVLRNR